MGIVFKRKMYKRGSSIETTIPKPMLFSLDSEKDYDVIFKFDNGEWIMDFEERSDKKITSKKNKSSSLRGKRGKK